jgi:hypothetical protein
MAFPSRHRPSVIATDKPRRTHGQPTTLLKAVTVRQDPELEQEWLRQDNIAYGGLIAIGVIMVQPFLTAASLDLTGRICIIAFSVAVPLLAALMLVNRQEAFRRRRTRSTVVAGAKVVAQSCAFIGVVAGFWHILWIAGVAVLASGLVGVAVHSAGYWRLERDA